MTRFFFSTFAVLAAAGLARAGEIPIIRGVEGQPLAANAARVLKTLDFLGTPLPADATRALNKAIEDKDAKKVQELLDKHVLFVVTINPEARVKVARGPGSTTIQQAGWTPVLVKVMNDSTVKKSLRIMSPQAGPVYSGRGRQAKDPKDDPKIVERFLGVEIYTAPPMTDKLSGLKVEYAIALIYSAEAGKREATIGFDIGQGNQDLGFRGEVPVLFDVKPAVAVKVRVTDFDGKPTIGRFTFTDASGHVYPPQAKRLAPDFFFQKQIYRPDGGTSCCRRASSPWSTAAGRVLAEDRRSHRSGRRQAADPGGQARALDQSRRLRLFQRRPPHPRGRLRHYTNPTEGVLPEDMFLHVKGEGLNVGCCLTWGPCYDYQRKFFEPKPRQRSEPFTVLKYDVEVSGFGSQALGHVCLLNLRDQTYPGSDGTKTKGWPTWTTPLMRWAKEQGAVTGYAHSANGLGVNPKDAAQRLFDTLDRTRTASISSEEAKDGKLPAAGTVRHDRCQQRRHAQRGGTAQEHRAHREQAAEPGIPRDERHRRAGDLRHDRAGRCATSSARWTRPACRNGTAGITS